MEGSSLLGCYKTHYNSFFFNPSSSSSSSSRYCYHYYSTTTTTSKAMSDWQPQFHTHQQGQEQEQQQHTAHSSSTIHMPPVDKTGRFCSPAESSLCMPPLSISHFLFFFFFFPSRERESSSSSLHSLSKACLLCKRNKHTGSSFRAMERQGRNYYLRGASFFA